eukprot:760477-Hanusia_phi.AAC.3
MNTMVGVLMYPDTDVGNERSINPGWLLNENSSGWLLNENSSRCRRRKHHSGVESEAWGRSAARWAVRRGRRVRSLSNAC